MVSVEGKEGAYWFANVLTLFYLNAAKTPRSGGAFVFVHILSLLIRLTQFWNAFVWGGQRKIALIIASSLKLRCLIQLKLENSMDLCCLLSWDMCIEICNSTIIYTHVCVKYLEVCIDFATKGFCQNSPTKNTFWHLETDIGLKSKYSQKVELALLRAAKMNVAEKRRQLGRCED